MTRRRAAAFAAAWIRRAARGLCPDHVALREARRHLRSTARTPSLMAELIQGDVD